MKILAVDISLIFSINWEAAEGSSLGTAHKRTVEAVAAARVGYDRCFLAVDSGPSFRKQIPEYKADREDRGNAYREQLKRTIDRLQADGCAVIVAPPVGTFPATGQPSYAEADDVLGWAVWQYVAHVVNLGEEDRDGWRFVIFSDDSDMEQLVDDEAGVAVLKTSLRGGEQWDEARVTEKRGVPPEKIADMKALCGDKADDYDGYCGELMPQDPATPNVKPKHKPGIGPAHAATLIKQYGGALEIFDLKVPDLAAQWEADGIKPGIRATLSRHGRAQAEKGLFLATICHELPGLDFAVVLAEPVVKKIVEAREYDDGTDLLATAKPLDRSPEVVGDTAALPVASTGLAIRAPAAISIQTSNFDTLAFQPKDPHGLWKCAETLFNSRVYAQFPNVESVFACIFEARERGVSAGVALRNAYIVKGKLAWSAAFMVALVKDSGLAKVFRIIETTSEKAVLEYQHANDPKPMLFTFTIAEAKNAGWLKSGERGDGKWLTNPRSMLRWAAMRECVRFAWPEVVAGIYTPDERRNGVTEEGDYPDEDAA